MDLAHVRAFVKVVQTGSFTRAAEALGTQKAHLSRLVSQLERELGARLLERTTRALALTEIGRDFFERSVGILASVEDAERAVQRAKGIPQGVLRLTCGVEFGMIAVSGWITRYLDRYPEVRIDADFTSRLVDIVHEGFDLAIRVGPLADSSLAARRLGELDYGLYASPTYLARRGAPTQPSHLMAHDLLAFSGGSHQPVWTLERGTPAERERITFEPRLRANNVFSVRDAAVASQGIAQLPSIVADPAREAGQLARVLQDWRPPSVPVHAVFASARYLTPKVRAFIDLAAERMASGMSRVATANPPGVPSHPSAPAGARGDLS
jgi:DNA-binding transcriptional LysR family regulator